MRAKGEGENVHTPQLVNFDHYRRNVLHHFVDTIREKLHDQVPGCEVQPCLTCTSWSDGDINQLKAISAPEMVAIDAQKKIISTKHSASRTGVEQPCDVGPTFRTMKQTAPSTSTTGAVSNLLHQMLAKAFREHKGVLDLKPTKQKALLDFLATLPHLLFHSASARAIMVGFIEAGLTMKPDGSGGGGSSGRRGPNQEGMESTVKRPMTLEEVRHYTEKLPLLIKSAIDNGHITEEEFEAAGIPADVDAQGNAAPREAGITQEHCQRSKVISHEEQQKERAALLEEHEQAVQDKKAQEDLKVTSTLSANDAAEKRIWELMGNDTPNPGQNIRAQLKNATLDQFAALSVALLTAFVHVRVCDTTKPTPGMIPKTKLNKEAAKAGTECLIKSAFELRAVAL